MVVFLFSFVWFFGLCFVIVSIDSGVVVVVGVDVVVMGCWVVVDDELICVVVNMFSGLMFWKKVILL